MAIIYQASIAPTKPELLTKLLGVPVEVVATYRFDDPAGEVGVEGFLLRRGEEMEHVVLTYRGAPLDDPAAQLISTMEHSTLGRRWVYDGATDPVALACFRRAVLGQQEQAVLEVWDGEQRVEVREQTVELIPEPGTVAPSVPDQGTVQVHRALGAGGGGGGGGARLTARWSGGEAVIAELVAPAR